jgi:Protein of unknown function (DUF3105)
MTNQADAKLRRTMLCSVKLARLASVSVFLSFAACSSAGPTASPVPVRTRPSGPFAVGACKAAVRYPVLLDSPHVAIGSDVSYPTNPPASGPHYPLWASFKEFDAAVDRRYTVHDLEHGAIVLSYKCAAPQDCAPLVTVLRAVQAALPQDPLCTSGIRNRVVITPDPKLDTPIAATAWGAIYTADCADRDSLLAFAKEHYAQGTENLCSDGISTF